MQKTSGIVYEILRNTGAVSKTKLLYLLFLVDFRALRELGRTLTHLEYTRALVGIVSMDLEKTLNKMYAKGHIRILEQVATDGTKFYLIETGKEIETRLEESERKVLDAVLQQYGKMDVRDLLSEIYKAIE